MKILHPNISGSSETHTNLQQRYYCPPGFIQHAKQEHMFKSSPWLSSIRPQTLVHELNWPRLSNWIPDILSNKVQTVRYIILVYYLVPSAWAQECELNHLLNTLLPHNCVTKHHINHVIKFAARTIIVMLFTNNNQTAYREEVRQLEVWCKVNYVSFSSCSRTLKLWEISNCSTNNIYKGMR